MLASNKATYLIAFLRKQAYFNENYDYVYLKNRLFPKKNISLFLISVNSIAYEIRVVLKKGNECFF